MKPAFYRRRSDGTLFNAAEVILMAKPNQSRYQLFLPRDESHWHDGVMEELGIDPVQPVEPPDFDPRFQNLSSRNAHLSADGEYWVQEIVVSEKSDTVEGQRALRVQAVRDRMELERDKGITFRGLKVSTKAAGAYRLNRAALTGKGLKDFVPSEGDPVTLSSAQVEELDVLVGMYVQAAYSTGAKLIRALNKAADPTVVDIDAEW